MKSKSNPFADGIPGKLYSAMRWALIECDDIFESDSALRRFVGTRTMLSSWRNDVEEAGNMSTRVESLIHKLSKRAHNNGTNALVLFILEMCRYYYYDKKGVGVPTKFDEFIKTVMAHGMDMRGEATRLEQEALGSGQNKLGSGW